MQTRFIHVRSRKLAPACLFLWSKPGSNLMRYSSLSSALHRSSGDFKTRQRIGFSVSPQLQFGRSLFVSRCNYLPRSSIWPVGSFGIYRPWKYQTQTLWVVPSIHFKFRHADLRCTIHRNKPQLQYTKSGNRKVYFVPGKQAHAICKSIKCSSAAHVEKLRNIKGSVSPQLQSGRSSCVSSCNYLPRWRIWPVESFGIFRPESTRHKLFLSCAIYSLQIPTCGFALHHP